jgi:catechol 2,3-dioxygenase-like lactoylglutathione lyase family enzyme
MTIEINGMAHVILTVSRFEVARAFYSKLLPLFGMKPVFDGDRLYYRVGGRTAVGIEPCAAAHRGERFVQQRIGLDHLCLRARSREDVDRCAAALKEIDATIVRGPEEGSWAPGITPSFSRIRTASAWKCASFPGLACFRPVRRSTLKTATAAAPRIREEPQSGSSRVWVARSQRPRFTLRHPLLAFTSVSRAGRGSAY